MSIFEAILLIKLCLGRSMSPYMNKPIPYRKEAADTREAMGCYDSSISTEMLSCVRGRRHFDVQ